MPSQRISSHTASRAYCCFGCHTKIRLLGRNQASVCCNWFDLRDERRWTCVVRAQQESAEAAGFVESRLEQGLYYLHGPSGLEAVAHTHVDDFLIAFKKASKTYKDELKHLVHELHLKQQSGMVVYCGRTISRMAITSR